MKSKSLSFHPFPLKKWNLTSTKGRRKQWNVGCRCPHRAAELSCCSRLRRRGSGKRFFNKITTSESLAGMLKAFFGAEGLFPHFKCFHVFWGGEGCFFGGLWWLKRLIRSSRAPPGGRAGWTEARGMGTGFAGPPRGESWGPGWGVRAWECWRGRRQSRC